MPSPRAKTLHLVPVACLFAGIVVSIALSFFVQKRERALLHEELRRSAAPLAAAIQRTIDRGVEIVEAIAGLFYASERVTRSEFQEFVRTPLAKHRHIQALEWVPRVRRPERGAFEAAARAEGLSGFTIHQVSEGGRLEPTPGREEYFPVYFVEPLEGNEPALGFDLASEEARRDALAKARDSGTTMATGPIRLVQEAGEQAGFLVLRPVYLGRRDATTPEARAAHLTGFALGVFRVGDLVQAAVKDFGESGLAFRLIDETDSGGPSLLYASPGHETRAGTVAKSHGEEPSAEALGWSTALTVPGRQWRAVFSPTDAHRSTHVHDLPHAWQILFTGSVITLLVSGYLLFVTRRSARIEGLAAGLARANRDLEKENAERLRAESDLRESEERLQLALAGGHVGIWEWDVATDGLKWDERVKRMFGLPPDARSPTLPEFVAALHPEDRAATERAYREALRDHKRHDHEFRVAWPDGSVHWIATKGRAFYDEHGKPTRMLGTGADITGRKEAEEGLRRSERRFREMAENIREVFWLFDQTEQRVVYASPAYETIWGRSAEDLYANYGEWGESIHPEDRALAEQSFAKTLETGGGEPREYRIVRPDGEVRWISDRAFAVRDEAGSVVRIAGIAEDITDKKREEEEHRRLEAKIQHAQKLESLGVLAGGIAHDFNNLLMGILGNADLALRDLAPESPGRGHVESIEKAGQRAAELTNQMLAYSGKGRFVVEPIDLNRLVREMGHLLETVISKKATLGLHLADPLPAVEADASQIRQVVMNLITNASEAMGQDSGTIRVSTGVVEADQAYLSRNYSTDELPPGPYVFLEVSDPGIGMDEETRQKIFDPFFTTKFTGRGLGLAAVLGIVRGHKGAIRVYSEPGQGTTFKVILPASEHSPARPERQLRRTEPEMAGATILLVDDDVGVLDVATTMLEMAGFRVLTAANGRDGIDVFRQHEGELALVLLDMTMPQMDGEEVFRELRRIRPDVRVILSSGYNEQDATNRFAGKGLAGFIQKPYRSAKLLDKIYEILEIR